MQISEILKLQVNSSNNSNYCILHCNKFGKKETNSTSEFYKLPADCPDKCIIHIPHNIIKIVLYKQKLTACHLSIH